MPTDNRRLICIRCPRGCELITSLDGWGHVASVQGNFCKLGAAYAESEISDPRRVVTTTVRVKGGGLLPVWTSGAVPKDKISSLLEILREVTVDTPVNPGDIILKDPLGIGIDVQSADRFLSTAPKKSLAKKGAC